MTVSRFSANIKEMPLKLVGSNKFGRYPKISVEQTYNMIISDNGLVPFAGYDVVSIVNPHGQGRSIYSSEKNNAMIVVIDQNVYVYDQSINKRLVGRLQTFTGDVYIAENNASQILISDLENLYFYNYNTETFNTYTGASLGFTPGYVSFQNSRFICPDTSSNAWRLSKAAMIVTDDPTFPNDAQHVGLIETKPDTAVATLRFPGRGNLLYVFGKTVTEPWFDVGSQLFPYQRSNAVNIDYGCLNPATIAESDTTICWLGINEKSGPVIMASNGSDVKHLSNDGIDFKLAELTNPQNSYGFMFRQDGHLIYVITFPDDNLTYMYDFNTECFFTLTDPDMNNHIAKRVAFFNNKYYFVSFIDGNLYELSSEITSASGKEIPRIRIPAPFRLQDQSRFVIAYAGFTIEQGTYDTNTPGLQTLLGTESLVYLVTEDGRFLVCQDTPDPHPQRVYLSLSKDGGVNFGNSYMKQLNPVGIRANRLYWWKLGAANDLTVQFRFYGLGRFVAMDGTLGVYQ